jgi:DNA-binding transcriptional regulator GbsR (MarR family)
MTNEEFIERVKEIRPAYMKACEDYLDALERLDFEAAMKHSISAPNLMGMDMMAYIMNKLKECESTEGFMEEYEKITEELEEALDTGE